MSPPGPTTPAPEAPAARRPLNRRRVLQAGLDYIDEHGLAELTMRRLATELGVEATSLYKHVTNKEDLQTGVTELVWEQIASTAPPNNDWAAWLRAYGHAIRDAINRHPNTLPIWFTQPISPVPALKLFDGQLAHCHPGTRKQGAAVIRAVSAFAIGYASTELSWPAAPAPAAGPPESDAQTIARIARALPPDAPDRLIDVALLMCTGDTTDTFETGLDLMVKGLAHPAT